VFSRKTQCLIPSLKLRSWRDVLRRKSV